MNGNGGRVYSRKLEEYMADFCLVSHRTLSEADYQIFQLYFVLGADWKFTAWKLQQDRGTFFHSIYRIEATLGKVFSQLKPYALYPLDEYFGGTVRKGDAPQSVA